MKDLYIYNQTRIGDQLVCYSIIKYYAEKYDKIHILGRDYGEMHKNNLKRLYSSLPNVDIMLFKTHQNTRFFINMFKQNEYLIFGHEDYEYLSDKKAADVYYYEKTGVPFDDKWNKFYFKRDLEKEKDIFYNVLKLKDEESFLFLQEDPLRKTIIKREYLDKSLKLIESSKFLDISLFDFLYTIEKAKEVHVINSSFLTLIDLMKLRNDGLIYHRYVRPGPPEVRLNWKILNE